MGLGGDTGLCDATSVVVHSEGFQRLFHHLAFSYSRQLSPLLNLNIMIFHVPNKDIQYLTLKIDNVIIEKVDEFSFLGLTMDTNLKWKRHSENICNKCTKMIGILNRLKYVLPLGIKIILYNSVILPHINYCIMAWGYKGIRSSICAALTHERT